MNWQVLDSPRQIPELIKKSKEIPVLIFKHSTTCNISRMMLDRLEKKWTEAVAITPYYLDLKQYRDVSNQIAEKFSVPHESPQILIIKDGSAIYDRSHFEINFEDLARYG